MSEPVAAPAIPDRLVSQGATRRHHHGMCPKCREDRWNGCICPEQHPEIRWHDCPVHGGTTSNEER